MFDLVIRNGSIIDGSGTNRFSNDIGINGNKITKIGFRGNEKNKTAKKRRRNEGKKKRKEKKSKESKTQGQFQDSKLAALKKIETDRITKSSIFWSYYTAQKRGLDSDVRKYLYEEIGKMEMSDLRKFFDEYIKDRKFSYCVIGKRDEVDFEALKKLGTVRELTLEEVFGY